MDGKTNSNYIIEQSSPNLIFWKGYNNNNAWISTSLTNIPVNTSSETSTVSKKWDMYGMYCIKHPHFSQYAIPMFEKCPSPAVFDSSRAPSMYIFSANQFKGIMASEEPYSEYNAEWVFCRYKYSSSPVAPSNVVTSINYSFDQSVSTKIEIDNKIYSLNDKIFNTNSFQMIFKKLVIILTLPYSAPTDAVPPIIFCDCIVSKSTKSSSYKHFEITRTYTEEGDINLNDAEWISQIYSNPGLYFIPNVSSFTLKM